MEPTSNTLGELLNEIKNELTDQISSVKNTEVIVDTRKLLPQTKALNDIIQTSEITEENKSMLQKFSLTLQDNSTVKSLRYAKQDLERIMSNLKND